MFDLSVIVSPNPFNRELDASASADGDRLAARERTAKVIRLVVASVSELRESHGARAQRVERIVVVADLENGGSHAALGTCHDSPHGTQNQTSSKSATGRKSERQCGQV